MDYPDQNAWSTIATAASKAIFPHEPKRRPRAYHAIFAELRRHGLILPPRVPGRLTTPLTTAKKGR